MQDCIRPTFSQTNYSSPQAPPISVPDPGDEPRTFVNIHVPKGLLTQT